MFSLKSLFTKREQSPEAILPVIEAPAPDAEATPAAQTNLRMATHPLTVDPSAADKIIRLKLRCERLLEALSGGMDLTPEQRQAYQSELDAKMNALKG